MTNEIQELLVAMVEAFIYKALYDQKLYLLAENPIEDSISALFSDIADKDSQQLANKSLSKGNQASSSQKKHKHKRINKKKLKPGLPITPRVKYKLLKVKANIVRKRIAVNSFEYARIVLEQMANRQNPIVYEL